MEITKYIDSVKAKEFRKAISGIRRTELGITDFKKRNNTFGIGGNTFRALVNLDNKPSQIYRAWALNICENLNIQYLARNLASDAIFTKWHRSLVRSLQQVWIVEQNQELSLAHSYKMVDLFVKWLSKHDFGSDEVTYGFETYANCAIDRQSLTMLNQCYSFAIPMSNPRMGDVQALATYQFVQEMITIFSLYCGGTRLLFDFFSWQKGR